MIELKKGKVLKPWHEGKAYWRWFTVWYTRVGYRISIHPSCSYLRL